MSAQQPKLKFTDMPDGWTPTKAERDRAHDAGYFYPDEREKVVKRLLEYFVANS